jgi:hypothetical protein
VSSSSASSGKAAGKTVALLEAAKPKAPNYYKPCPASKRKHEQQEQQQQQQQQQVQDDDDDEEEPAPKTLNTSSAEQRGGAVEEEEVVEGRHEGEKAAAADHEEDVDAEAAAVGQEVAGEAADDEEKEQQQTDEQANEILAFNYSIPSENVLNNRGTAKAVWTVRLVTRKLLKHHGVTDYERAWAMVQVDEENEEELSEEMSVRALTESVGEAMVNLYFKE